MSSDNTLIVILPSGEHIIGEVIEKNGAYVVTDPLHILSEPDTSTGQMRIAFVPYMPYSCGSFVVPTGIAGITEPTDELRDYYSQKFGKIITPPSKIIT